jgi:hypothetical protein
MLQLTLTNNSVTCFSKELFIQSLAQRAYQDSGEKDVSYKHVAEVIQSEEEFEFLRGMFFFNFV